MAQTVPNILALNYYVERCERMQKGHIRMLKSLSPCPSLVDYGNTQKAITQLAPKVSEFKMLKLGH